MDFKQKLKEMCLIPALSGHEREMADYLSKEFKALGFEPYEDVAGNVMITVTGDNPELDDIMIFGHMDELGFLVRYIEDNGFLRLERLGGIPEKVLPALEVMVQNIDGEWIPGVIGNKAHHATKPEEKYVVERYTNLFVDIGAKSRKEVEDLGIFIGQPIVYSPKFNEMLNNRVSGTSMDNRLACTLLLSVAEFLSQNKVDNTVHIVGTVQEEYNLRGAMMAARRLQPKIAIGLDIALESGTPNMEGVTGVHMDDGPVMSLYNFHGRGTLNGTIAHPGMVKFVTDVASKMNIPLQRSANIGSLTDLAYVQFEGEGVKCVDLGVPCRYTHTPVELLSLNDLEKTANLLNGLVSRLHEYKIER